MRIFHCLRHVPVAVALLACGGEGTPLTPDVPGIQSVTVMPGQVRLQVGDRVPLAATVTLQPGAEGRPVLVWSSSAPAVATVGAASGEVTALAVGRAQITATATLGASAAVGISEVTVAPEVAALVIEGMPGVMVPGSEALLTARAVGQAALPAGEPWEVQWDTDRPDIATVSPDGVLRAGNTPGMVRIRATAGRVSSTRETLVSKTALPGRLAVGEVTGLYSQTVWLVPLNGEPRTRIGAITSYVYFAGAPAWSRDRDRLLFVCTEPVALCTLSLSGETAVVPNTAGLPDVYFGAAWSPGDSLIVFTGRRSAGSSCYGDCLGAWAIRPDGSGLRPIATAGTDAFASAGGLRLSPDGRYGAYQILESVYDGGPLCVRPAPFDHAAGHCTTEDAGAPSWAPDGSRMAMRVGSDLRIMAGDGGGPEAARLVGSFQESLTSPTFSPDGQWIAFQRWRGGRPETSTIWVVRTDGSNLLRLTGPGWVAPAWGR